MEWQVISFHNIEIGNERAQQLTICCYMGPRSGGFRKMRNLRSKFALSMGLLGLLCVMLPGSLRADTVYTYTGDPYSGCSGSYTCTGTAPFLSLTIDIKAGTPLKNLPLLGPGNFSPGGNIASDISTFSFSDGTGLTITQANWDSNASGFFIATNASGDITNWFVNVYSFNAPLSAQMFTDYDPFSLDFSTPNGDNCAIPCGAYNAGWIYNDPGTWAAPVTTPEPSMPVLLGIALLGLMALAAHSKFNASRTSC
jgi:hypothetical protein